MIIKELSTKISNVTKSFWKERKILLDREAIPYFRELSFKSDDLSIIFYSASTHNRKGYKIQVLFLDVKSIIKDKKEKYRFSENSLKTILNNADVKLDCGCDAFNWQGMKYKLSTIDSAINPTKIADKIWGRRHDQMNYVCKHLYKIVKIINNDVNRYYRILNTKRI